MQLRRIEIRDFRKIAHRVVDGLDDGLNVVVGDNEAGKSTMLAALRAVFFERHTLGGESARAMLPYGANVRPEVDVVFDIAGVSWRLRKAFCQKPEAELVGPGERHVGGAVEDRLADLLGFTPPGRGASKPDEHHGTHGLLWVEQGQRQNLGIGAGRDTLAAALEREVGQVTGGDRGRKLLSVAAERKESLWGKNNKLRGEPKAMRDDIERLDGERAGLQHRQREYEEKITRLTDLLDKLARSERDDRLPRAVTAVTSARAQVATAEALDGRLAKLKAARVEAERDRAAAEEGQTRRTALIAEGVGARRGAELAGQVAAEAQALLERRIAQAAAADTRSADARRQRDSAETHGRACEEALTRTGERAALADRQAHFALAEAQDQARREAAARVAARTIDRDTVAALAKLERTAETTRRDLDAASVQIRFEPDAPGRVTIDGAEHDPATPLALSRDAVLSLEGWGRLVLRPGGGTKDLLGRAEAAEQALREALARADVASVSEARIASEARAAAETEVTTSAKTLAALAPKGIEALRQDLDMARARLALPLSDGGEALLGSVDDATVAAARRALATAREVLRDAELDGKTHETARQNAALDAARVAERFATLQRQAQILDERLGAARDTIGDGLLAERLAATSTALDAARTAEAQAATALDAADLDTARLTLERASAAERTIRADLDALDRERRDLQAELRGRGQDGIGEMLGAIEEELEVLHRRLAAKELEASASRLLHDTLLAAQSEAKDRWLGPVRARVGPYLKLMAPGSDIVIDERTLEIQGYSRNGQTEPFEGLSMGAREQVAVITRLALADVLRAAGHPATVILDDALVNTDEMRLERMHNVLVRAGKGLQILILTCRERDFVGLGKLHRM